MYAVEDPKPIDDFGVLPMVQNFELRANWVNSFGLKWITKRLKQKVTTKEECKRVRVPGLPEFIVTADIEASDASESAAVAPPPAPLVIKLSAQKQATDKAVPDLGRASSIFTTRIYTHTHVYICRFFFFISSSFM